MSRIKNETGFLTIKDYCAVQGHSLLMSDPRQYNQF